MRNRFMRRIVAVLFLLAMVIPFAIPATAAEPDRYGYSLLTNDAQRAAYRELAEGIGNMSESIDLSNIGIGEPDLEIVVDIVASDYPEYFWFTGAYYLTVGEVVISFTPATKENGSNELVKGYGLSGTVVSKNSPELAAAQNAFQLAVNAALAQIPAGASDYKKTEILHDYLASIVTYESNLDDQTAYGALVLGRAVCAGYTRAYQYLLHRAGIRSWYVSGQSYSPDGQLVAHAWNLVWLDGCCYYTDVTWDDQGDKLFHHYLNLSLEQMQTGHFTSDPVPAACGHTQYTYFKMNAAPGKGVCDMSGNETGGDLAKYFILQFLSGDQAVYTCNLHFHGGDFSQWINAQIPAMTEALNLTGQIGYSYSNMGLEYQVMITGTVKNSADVPSVPSGGTDSPPANTQPQTQPTQQPDQTQPSQPVAATTPPAEPDSTQNTDPIVIQPTEESIPGTSAENTSPTDPSASADPSFSVPGTTEPSDSGDSTEPDTFPVILIAISVVVIVAGVTTVILIRKGRK